jgi:hypothetical protein
MPSNWDKESVAFENPAARRNGGPCQQPTGSGMQQPPDAFAGVGAAVRADCEGGGRDGDGSVLMTCAGHCGAVGRGSSRFSL